MNRAQALNLLGLSNNPTEEEIKKAYRKKAMEFHPDKNPNDPKAEDKFKEINSAYEFLTKPNKSEGFERSAEDFFNDLNEFFFNRSKQGPTVSKKPSPPQAAVNFGPIKLGVVSITLKDLWCENAIKLNYKIKSSCGECLTDTSSWYPCSACGQTGQIIQRTSNILGTFSHSFNCHICGGLGWKRSKHCKICKDNLFILKQKQISCAIPSGFSKGTYKLGGQGNENWNCPNGDLFFEPKIVLPSNTEGKLNKTELKTLKSLLDKLY